MRKLINRVFKWTRKCFSRTKISTESVLSALKWALSRCVGPKSRGTSNARDAMVSKNVLCCLKNHRRDGGRPETDEGATDEPDGRPGKTRKSLYQFHLRRRMVCNYPNVMRKIHKLLDLRIFASYWTRRAGLEKMGIFSRKNQDARLRRWSRKSGNFARIFPDALVSA